MSDEPRPECCLCDQSFPTWGELAAHVLAAHDGTRVPGGEAIRGGHQRDDGDNALVACWCFWIGYRRDFGRHLQGHGGMAAHLLEYVLDDGPPF